MKLSNCLGRASEIGGVESPSKMRSGAFGGVDILKADSIQWLRLGGHGPIFSIFGLGQAIRQNRYLEPCWPN